MASLKPIISSSISDLPELLFYDKNLLFDPAKPDTIKRAICYLISLSEKELIHIGHKNEKIAREKFDKVSNVSKYLELFN
jgi:glycosyltransferase involved in cell wall biosynthesis